MRIAELEEEMEDLDRRIEELREERWRKALERIELLSREQR